MRRLIILFAITMTACIHTGNMDEPCNPDGTCAGALLCTMTIFGNSQCELTRSLIDTGIEKAKASIVKTIADAPDAGTH